MLQQGERQGLLSHSHALGLAHLQPPQPESALLCYPGKMQSPLSQVLLLVRGRANSPVPMTLGSACSPAAGRENRESISPWPTTAGRWQDQSHSHTLGVDSPAISLQPGPDSLCCPGKMQGQLSQVLQPVRGRVSSPLLPAEGNKDRV